MGRSWEKTHDSCLPVALPWGWRAVLTLSLQKVEPRPVGGSFLSSV